MFDFIAIDFETANTNMNSGGSIGIVGRKNGIEAEECDAVIKPKRGKFYPENIAIHGITPEMVADSKTLDEIWPEIAHFFDEHIPVFAHNVRFDMSVLKQSASVELPEFWYADSIDAADHFVEGSKSLMACASALCVSVEHHHDALDDARVCANIVACAMAKDNISNIWEFISKEGVGIYRFSELVASKNFGSHRHEQSPERKPFKFYHNKVSPADVSRTVDSIDESNPLFGKNIVFTGDMSIDRKEAMQIAVNCGAVVKSGVSRKTDYLVVGVQDKAIVGEDGMSGKEEKAYELNAAGTANITFLSEEQFLNMTKVEVHE